MFKLKIAVAALAALLVAGCTTNPVPEGYTGPTANVADSYTQRGGTGVDFFFLAKVDGHAVYESLTATAVANSGNGFAMTPSVVERPIPAKPSTVTIKGRTHYAAPILELANTVYEISGDVAFNPLPNHSYVVKGVLEEAHSAVWIEDKATGQVVGNKIEVEGSTALGLLEK